MRRFQFIATAITSIAVALGFKAKAKSSTEGIINLGHSVSSKDRFLRKYPLTLDEVWNENEFQYYCTSTETYIRDTDGNFIRQGTQRLYPKEDIIAFVSADNGQTWSTYRGGTLINIGDTITVKFKDGIHQASPK